MRARLKTLLGRAGPMTLTVAAAQATVAWAGTSWLARALALSLPDDGLAMTPARLGAALDAVWRASGALPSTAAAAGVYLLLSPLLLLAWLRAIALPNAFGTHLFAAARRYPAALALSLAAATAWALLALGAVLALHALDLLTPQLPSRALWGLGAGAGLALALSALALATLSDLCQGALGLGAGGSLRRASVRGARALRLRLLSHRAASALAALACSTAGDLLARVHGLPLADITVPFAVQAAALAAILARGHFLCAVCEELRSEPAAPDVSPR